MISKPSLDRILAAAQDMQFLGVETNTFGKGERLARAIFLKAYKLSESELENENAIVVSPADLISSEPLDKSSRYFKTGYARITPNTIVSYYDRLLRDRPLLMGCALCTYEPGHKTRDDCGVGIIPKSLQDSYFFAWTKEPVSPLAEWPRYHNQVYIHVDYGRKPDKHERAALAELNRRSADILDKPPKSRPLVDSHRVPVRCQVPVRR
jgi:hypothetical protein